ncbi:MAG: hypothetical protein JNK45_18935 [Myxococcales bacterium]|nr:hypothetical protein [Myxococcales bacterium]
MTASNLRLRRISKLLASALLAHLVGCADPGENHDSTASGASDSAGASSEVCYFEYRASYSCSDGDGDPGEWEATCSAIIEDACGGPDFVGSSDYVDGCIFRTEFRSVQWLDADECEAMLPDAEPEAPSSTSSPGTSTGTGGPAD